MPNELSPQECAELLEKRAKLYHPCDKTTRAMNQASAVMRKLAAGELREVVHGYWENYGYLDQCCSVCKESPERECGETPPDYDICPYCGALMDAKENNNATD